MPYKVLDMREVMETEAPSEVDRTEGLQQSLNQLEEDGWSLVSVVEQHRHWPSNALNPAGHLEGPYFIFHKPKGPTKVGILA